MVAAVTTRKNGFAEMAYVGEVPWHGLGQKLEAGLSIEEWKKASGMDWRIQRSQIRYCSEISQDHVLPEQHVLFRSDTKAALGLVSDKYKVVQPGEVLEFFRDLTEANGYQLNTAGTLFDGKRFWALAAVGENAVVVGDDQIGGYLLLSTSCDGTLATTARFTTIRVVCNNTLTMALKGKAKEVVVTHRSAFDPNVVKQQLGLARGHFAEFLTAARELAKKPMVEAAAKDFVEEILLETKTIFSAKPRETRQFKTVMDLFRGLGKGAELKGTEGTAWGVVNAVTEFVDHHAKGSTPSHKLANAWFGRGDDLKSQALAKALQLV